jgi:glycosyltransferase involved in cell wall biosynthesis
MVTIAFTYFQSLTLANLTAALYSVRQQDFTPVKEVIVVDNNTPDRTDDIMAVITDLNFPVPVALKSYKHGIATRTHAWSANVAVRAVTTPWVFFTRADYLLDFSIVRRFCEVANEHPDEWNGFIVSHGCHLVGDVESVEHTNWRETGPRFQGVVFDYTDVDAGVWMARRFTFDWVGGFDERLTAWGHAQTYFQHRMWQAGAEFVRIPEVLFYHPWHDGPRDLGLANQQLAQVGVDLKTLWQRAGKRSWY